MKYCRLSPSLPTVQNYRKWFLQIYWFSGFHLIHWPRLVTKPPLCIFQTVLLLFSTCVLLSKIRCCASLLCCALAFQVSMLVSPWWAPVTNYVMKTVITNCGHGFETESWNLGNSFMNSLQSPVANCRRNCRLGWDCSCEWAAACKPTEELNIFHDNLRWQFQGTRCLVQPHHQIFYRTK